MPFYCLVEARNLMDGLIWWKEIFLLVYWISLSNQLMVSNQVIVFFYPASFNLQLNSILFNSIFYLLYNSLYTMVVQYLFTCIMTLIIDKNLCILIVRAWLFHEIFAFQYQFLTHFDSILAKKITNKESMIICIFFFMYIEDESIFQVKCY